MSSHTLDEYIAQATHNVDVATHLRSTSVYCLDWAATCLFYAAVHLVNAFLRKHGVPIPRRHRGKPDAPGRTNIVQQDPRLRVIYKSYRHLDDESRDARYELKRFVPADYDDFLLPEFRKLQGYLMARLVD